eukprot:ANDGO_07324.mRNA.1 hypothetical protein
MSAAIRSMGTLLRIASDEEWIETAVGLPLVPDSELFYNPLAQTTIAVPPPLPHASELLLQHVPLTARKSSSSAAATTSTTPTIVYATQKVSFRQSAPSLSAQPHTHGLTHSTHYSRNGVEQNEFSKMLKSSYVRCCWSEAGGETMQDLDDAVALVMQHLGACKLHRTRAVLGIEAESTGATSGSAGGGGGSSCSSNPSMHASENGSILLAHLSTAYSATVTATTTCRSVDNKDERTKNRRMNRWTGEEEEVLEQIVSIDFSGGDVRPLEDVMQHGVHLKQWVASAIAYTPPCFSVQHPRPQSLQQWGWGARSNTGRNAATRHGKGGVDREVDGNCDGGGDDDDDEEERKRLVYGLLLFWPYSTRVLMEALLLLYESVQEKLKMKRTTRVTLETTETDDEVAARQIERFWAAWLSHPYLSIRDASAADLARLPVHIAALYYASLRARRSHSSSFPSPSASASASTFTFTSSSSMGSGSAAKTTGFYSRVLTNPISGHLSPVELALFVFSYPPHEWAAQFTLFHHALFCAIQPHELIGAAWNVFKKRFKAPNVGRCSTAFNSTTEFWRKFMDGCTLLDDGLADARAILDANEPLRTSIFERTDLSSLLSPVDNEDDADSEQRRHEAPSFAARGTRFVAQVTLAMFGLRNYSGVQAMLFCPIKVDPASTTAPQIDAIAKVMSNSENSKAYRKALAASLAGTEPYVPFMGVYQGDLFYLDENPTKLSDGSRNMFKVSRITGILRDIENCQARSYALRAHKNEEMHIVIRAAMRFYPPPKT